MVLPIARPGSSADRAVEATASSAGLRGADDDVVAAACAGVTSVEHEFLCAEPRLPRLFVERCLVIAT